MSAADYPQRPLAEQDEVIWGSTPARWLLVHIDGTNAVLWHSDTRSCRVAPLDRLRRAGAVS